MLSEGVRNHLALAILLALFLTVTTTYGLLNPLGEAPDEVAHMDLIRFIGQQGHLPRTYEERYAAGYKSDSPMLYHLLLGAGLGWVDYDVLPRLKASSINPRRLLIEDGLPPFAVIHTDDESPPFEGIVLAWHLGRLASALFSAGTLAVIYLIALTICPANHRLALGVTAVVAAIPEFHFIASAVNDDNLLGLLMALFTLCLVRAWQHPAQRRTYAWAGLWLGLALTTKYSVGLLPLLVVAMLPLSVRRAAIGRRAALGRLAIFMATLIIAVAWWFIYVEWYFSQVPELGLVAGLVKPLLAGGPADASMRQVASLITGGALSVPTPVAQSAASWWDWADGLFLSFWLPADHLSATARAAFSVGFLVLSLLAVGGLVKCVLRIPYCVLRIPYSVLRASATLPPTGYEIRNTKYEIRNGGLIGLLVFQVLLLLVFPIARFYLTGNPLEAGQGRHVLFPAAAAVGLLLIAGMSAWFAPARRRWIAVAPCSFNAKTLRKFQRSNGKYQMGLIFEIWYLSFVFAGILLGISLINFFALTLPGFPARLPVRTSADATTSPTSYSPRSVPTPAPFELVGYELGEVNRFGTLPITLTWRSLEYANQDYLVELTARDKSGAVGGLWLGYPVNGRYPTRAWDPGDVVRDLIWLPLSNAQPGEYRLCLCLRPASRLQSSEVFTQTSVRHQCMKMPGRWSPELVRAWPQQVEDSVPSGSLFSQEIEAISPGEDECVPLGRVTVPVLSVRRATHVLKLPGDSSVMFEVWQAGEPAGSMATYRFRSAIPITLRPYSPRSVPTPYSLILVGADGVEQAPIIWAGDTYIFLVSARWPSGDYRLRVKTDDGQVSDSDPVLSVKVRPRTFEVPPMTTPVHADFGGEIMLLGYDFPERRVKAGNTLPITLYWQARQDVQRHYIVFNHLLGADLHQWGGRDRVPRDYYSTALWTAGEVVRDDYLVPVDRSAPPGIYRLDVGLYEQVAGQSRSMPLVTDGKPLDANSVTVASIKVDGPPPGVTVGEPTPQHIRHDQLGGAITLVGYDLSLEPGMLNLILYWQCDARLSGDYTTFVHVRRAGSVVAQMDRPPANGAYPTSLWDAGEVIRDSLRVPLKPEVPPGEYEIAVGLYDFSTGIRLPTVGSTPGDPGDGAVSLATITIGDR